ncbi:MULTISPECIES: hypothetical protein [unclassified Streptomyces]|uniref:hypothetical protein n=1 Tax=unclassified Streptomyces TaxID=2593676 RepID=UPI003804C76B
MDDLAAPVTGAYSDAPRLPLLTLVEARDAVRLLMHFAEAGDADSEEELDAFALATDRAGRLPSE